MSSTAYPIVQTPVELPRKMRQSRILARVDAQAAPGSGGENVVRLVSPHPDVALVESLRRGQVGAFALLLERHGPYVERLLVRVLGADPELPDLLQEIFAQVLVRIGELREPRAFKSWLGSVTIFSARKWIRAQGVRRRWVRHVAPDEVPDVPATNVPDPLILEALARTYAVLRKLPADERIVFALRFIDGMDLLELATLAGVSLATVKRRLGRAEQRFTRLASRDPVLGEHIAASPRWGAP